MVRLLLVLLITLKIKGVDSVAGENPGVDAVAVNAVIAAVAGDDDENPGVDPVAAYVALPPCIINVED